MNKALLVIVALIVAAAAISATRLDVLAAFFSEHGLFAGAAVIAFFGFHWWLHRLHEKSVNAAEARATDREREIERYARESESLRKENSEYRVRFLELIDRMTGRGEKR